MNTKEKLLTWEQKLATAKRLSVDAEGALKEWYQREIIGMQAYITLLKNRVKQAKSSTKPTKGA